VARLLGDQRKREQLEVSLGEHTADAKPIPAAASAPTEAGAFARVTAKSPRGPHTSARAAVMS
jgi:hypothetical protein